MQMLFCNAAALAVALLFYTWRAYHQALLARRRVLRERVAYMLWVIAERMEPECEAVSIDGVG
ncbi:MAG TPA: hypothetical protein VMS17_28715 [Gemmataceae bacterium]|nr:hypothetical protein [Gemmataceae bacterium]